MWTDNDIDVAEEVVREPSSLIWNTWKEDPTKITVIQAIISCRVKLISPSTFERDMTNALAQKEVRFLPVHWKWRKCITSSFQTSTYLNDIFSSLSKHPDFWKPSASITPEDNHEAS